MTDRTHPEALRALAESVAWTGRWYDAGCNTVHCTYDKEDSIEHDEIAHPGPLGVSGYIAAAHPQAVIALLDRIAELEAQLESIGAGGVSGPLMGRAPIAASAGSEPVAWLVCTEEGDPDMVFPSQHEAQQYLEDDERPTPLYLHPSPPEGVVGGWRPIETAPKEGVFLVYMQDEVRPARRMEVAKWHPNVKTVGGLFSFDCATVTHWTPLPPPPTTSAGSEKRG